MVAEKQPDIGRRKTWKNTETSFQTGSRVIIRVVWKLIPKSKMFSLYSDRPVETVA